MSLRRAAASGVLWTAASTILATVLRLVILAVLARHLSKVEFGAAGMLLAITAVMQAFGDFGLSAVIVQRETFSRDQLSSVFWLAQLAGIAIFGAIAIGEPVIVEFYGEPMLAGYVSLVALRFVLTPAGIPFNAILQRDLEFRRAFVVSTLGAAATTLVTIVAAVRGHGIYAIIAGDLAGAATGSLLALALGWSHWHPTARLRMGDLRGPLAFGLYQLGERALNLFATNIDNILIGRTLGPAVLAVYAVAFELASLPARLNAVVTRVAFPILSRRQHDTEAFRRGFLELLRIVALVQLPACIALAAFAPLYVPVVLGADWSAAIPCVQILAGFGAIRALGNPSGPVFLAKGRAAIGFYFNLVVAAAAWLVFWRATPHGIVAVSWAWVALGAAQLVALFAILARLVEMTLAQLVLALARVGLLAGLAVGYAVLARALATAGATHQQALGIAAAVFLALLLPTAWLLEGAVVRSFVAALRKPRAEPT